MTLSRFDRKYELVIELPTGEAIRITQPMRVQFEGSKSIYTGLNKLTARIYNLKESTRLKLIKYEEDNSVYIRAFLQAGYDQLQAVFIGNIQKAGSEKAGTDYITTIECLDGGRDYLASFTSKTVKGKDNAIRAIIDDMPNTNIGRITNQVSLIRPKVLVGNSAKLIEQQLMEDEFFYIDEEKVYIIKNDEVTTTAAVQIDASTGLLGTPERKNQIVTARVLMNPLIKLGGLVNLQTTSAKHLNGLYRAETIAYKGDIEGQDWEMSIDMRQAEGFRIVA